MQQKFSQNLIKCRMPSSNFGTYYTTSKCVTHNTSKRVAKLSHILSHCIAKLIALYLPNSRNVSPYARQHATELATQNCITKFVASGCKFYRSICPKEKESVTLCQIILRY